MTLTFRPLKRRSLLKKLARLESHANILLQVECLAAAVEGDEGAAKGHCRRRALVVAPPRAARPVFGRRWEQQI